MPAHFLPKVGPAVSLLLLLLLLFAPPLLLLLHRDEGPTVTWLAVSHLDASPMHEDDPHAH